MTASLLIKGQGFQEGRAPLSSPSSSPLRWMTLERLGVVAPRPFESQTGGDELVLALLSGEVTLETTQGRFERIGGRADPFAGGPTFLCLPPNTAYQLSAATAQVDVLAISAPAEQGETVTVVRPEDAPARIVGAGNWVRTVWPGTSLAHGTRRLMVGETLNPPGGWSSYPPHKHDVDDPPREAVYEEVYFFSIKPAGGFGIQRIYERHNGADALNEVYVVEDGDVVVIPRGYHPVVAAPGYQVSYVWALRGMERRYGAWTEDPAHAWLRNVEPMLNAR
jgi:5-deoxy-glucuronate isomerase